MASKKRLIDAEAIARKLKNAHCAECNVVRKIQCSACWVEDVLELLEGDTVDAVEVVRCKDCIHSRKTGREGYLFCITSLGMGRGVVDADFCSEGKRRDNERKAD